MIQKKSLNELYQYREEIGELITFAKLYKGKVNLKDKIVSLEELQEELRNIKAEIAVRISDSKLRIVK